jgi:hypothetical protein
VMLRVGRNRVDRRLPSVPFRLRVAAETAM